MTVTKYVTVTRKTDWQFLKKLNIHLLYDAAIPLPHVYPRKKKSYNVHTKTCTTYVYTDRRMDIQTMAYLYNRIILSNKKRMSY